MMGGNEGNNAHVTGNIGQRSRMGWRQPWLRGISALCLSLSCWVWGAAGADQPVGTAHSDANASFQNMIPMQDRAVLSTVSSFRYDPRARRDPFRPLIARRSTTDQLPGTTVPSKESDEIKVLGIMFGTEGVRALLQMADGRRRVVAQGHVVEPDGLLVKNITQHQVRLEWKSGVRDVRLFP